MSQAQIILLGLTMGIAGSLHCLGMCGPLVLALFRKKDHSGYLIYHIGKSAAYILIGLAFGILGQTFHLFLSMQKLSILAGVSLLIYTLIQFGSQWAWIKSFPNLPVIVYSTLRKLLSYLRLNPRYFAGFLNGFLPCGLVYVAATSSIASGNILHSMLWMLSFGIGTLPSLSLVYFSWSNLEKACPGLTKNLQWRISFIIAILLIFRGLNLGIPILSPHCDSETKKVECCHK